MNDAFMKLFYYWHTLDTAEARDINEQSVNNMTINDIWSNIAEDQKQLCYAMLGLAIQDGE